MLACLSCRCNMILMASVLLCIRSLCPLPSAHRMNKSFLCLLKLFVHLLFKVLNNLCLAMRMENFLVLSLDGSGSPEGFLQKILQLFCGSYLKMRWLKMPQFCWNNLARAREKFGFVNQGQSSLGGRKLCSLNWRRLVVLISVLG